MKYIISVNGWDFYWKAETKEVVRDESTVYRVVGYADNPEEAKEAVMLWVA